MGGGQYLTHNCVRGAGPSAQLQSSYSSHLTHPPVILPFIRLLSSLARFLTSGSPQTRWSWKQTAPWTPARPPAGAPRLWTLSTGRGTRQRYVPLLTYGSPCLSSVSWCVCVCVCAEKRQQAKGGQGGAFEGGEGQHAEACSRAPQEEAYGPLLLYHPSAHYPGGPQRMQQLCQTTSLCFHFLIALICTHLGSFSLHSFAMSAKRKLLPFPKNLISRSLQNAHRDVSLRWQTRPIQPRGAAAMGRRTALTPPGSRATL